MESWKDVKSMELLAYLCLGKQRNDGSGASAVAVRLVDGAERVVVCLDNIIVVGEQLQQWI